MNTSNTATTRRRYAFMTTPAPSGLRGKTNPATPSTIATMPGTTNSHVTRRVGQALPRNRVSLAEVLLLIGRVPVGQRRLELIRRQVQLLASNGAAFVRRSSVNVEE